MPTTQQLREQRANVWEGLKALMDAAEKEGRSFTGEETETYARGEVDLDRLGEEIERQERHDARKAEMEKVDRSGVVPDQRDGRTAGADKEPTATERYERAFSRMIRDGISDLEPEDKRTLMDGFVDKRALGAGTPSAGGYTVPPGFRAELISIMKSFGGMLQVAEIIETDTGANLQWPVNDDTGNIGAILAENTQMSEQDVTLSTNSIDAYMYYSKLCRISVQLVQDSAFNVESWLQGKLGERVGRILNAHFSTGTGTSQPDGLVTGAPAGKTGAAGQTTTVVYDDLIDLIDSLDPAYQGNAQFMLSQSARKSVRKLKDTTGQPLWQPSVQAGNPDRLLGYEYVINQDMPAPAASAKSILFGDFKQAYVIRLVTDPTIIRFGERYMDYLQYAYALYQRADGTLQNPSAVRAYVNAAS